MNRRSLAFRLIFWYCGLLLLLGAAFAAYTVTSFERYIRETTRAALASRVDAAFDMIRTLPDDAAGLAILIEQRFAPEIQNRFVRVSVDRGVVYQSGTPTEHLFDPAAIPLTDAAKPRFVKQDHLFLYARRFTLADGRLMTIEAGQTDELAENVESGLVASLLIGLPLLLLFAAGGGYVLMRRAQAPVEAMIKAAEALTFNSPSKRLPLTGTGDRIEALGRTLNRMLERLDIAYQHASRFSADAAHELRTPLSIMRGELELVATSRSLPPDLQVAIGNILEETTRLSHIIESLTNLSRIDSIWGKRAHSHIDLRALAVETIEQMHLLAEEKGIVLSCTAGPPVMAAGDRDRLKQVLVNLLDNAIKYTATGGCIVVTVAVAAGTVTVTVADSGIGIAPEHQDLVFERFYRVAADRGETGAGLGLSIVRSICHAHGGKVSVISKLGAGSSFCVELPTAPAGPADLGDTVALQKNEAPASAA